jgi:hypothetical protein
MRSNSIQRICLIVLAVIAFTSCKKEKLQPAPDNPGDDPPPAGNPAEVIRVKLQAVVTIGTITYDSIPALWRIISWDAGNVAHQRDTLLAAGVQTITVPKGHTRFQFSMTKWGISDHITLEKEQLQENIVYTLGGQKAAKRLSQEAHFLYVIDTYQPSAKIVYNYNASGLSTILMYQKKPQSADLQLIQKQSFSYTGSNVSRIAVSDAADNATGFTDFTYNAQGTKITNMHQRSYDVETFAAVEHSYLTGTAEVAIDFLYNNGHSLAYTMQLKGGNKISDRAISSTGAGEGGTYTYDFNINPYAHMNKPDIFLSGLSKNNRTGEQKHYGGSVPMAVVYKSEYRYDDEGYPVELIQYYKGYLSGEHLYKTKTVFTYL